MGNTKSLENTDIWSNPDFKFYSVAKRASMKVDKNIFQTIDLHHSSLGIDEMYRNDDVLSFVIYTSTDYKKGEYSIEENDFSDEVIKVLKYLQEFINVAKKFDYDEIEIFIDR